MTPNKHMQRSGTDKVLGRGRGHAGVIHVGRARVLRRTRAVADVGRWATLVHAASVAALLMLAGCASVERMESSPSSRTREPALAAEDSVLRSSCDLPKDRELRRADVKASDQALFLKLLVDCNK